MGPGPHHRQGASSYGAPGVLMRFKDMSTRKLKKAYLGNIRWAWRWESRERGLGADFMEGAKTAREELQRRGVWLP